MIDSRNNVTRGQGVIVLRVENGYAFYEHPTIAAAKAEAERLALHLGGAFAVYAPVAIVKPAPKTVTEAVAVPDLDLRVGDRDEYPF